MEQVGAQILQTATMAAILELSRLVCSTLDLDEVFSRILRASRDLSGADVVSLMLIDESGERLAIVAGLGMDPQRCAALRLRVGEGIAGWAVAHDQSVHLSRPDDDPRFARIEGEHYGALYSVPLRGRSGMLGALNLSRRSGEELFSPEAVQTVDIFASHAAIAIENATAAQALRHAAARERISGLVSQAPREPGAAGRTVGLMLAELGAALEAAGCALLQPASAGSWSPAVTWPASADDPGPSWFPDYPDDDGALAPAVIAAAVAMPAGGPAWLTVRLGRRARVSQGGERELVRFAADEVARLFAAERRAIEERRRGELIQTLSQLGAAGNALVGQGEALDFILDQLARFIPYDSAGVFVYRDELYARLVSGRGFGFSQQEVVLYMGPGSLPYRLSEGRRALYVPDVQALPEWQDVPGSDLIRSWIGVPLLVQGELIGVLTIDKWRPGAFSADDLQVAELFGDHMGVAIRNARLVQEARGRASQLQSLHRISVGLAAMRRADQLFSELARLLHSAFGYFQVSVLTVEDGHVVLQAAAGTVGQVEAFGHLSRFPVSRGLIGWAARHGETLLVNDVRRDPRYFCAPPLNATRAELVVPIRRDREVLGLINLESNVLGAFDENDVYVAEALAGQAAVALENIRRYEELRRTQSHLVHSERLRALGELSSGVAHDFNNLLSSILGHTQILLAEVSDPATAEGLRIIERAALDGAATVRRMQSFAQTVPEPEPEPVSLNAIVEESLAITRPRWRDATQSKGLRLMVEQELGAPPTLLGDAAALRELATNLILNALDAMPEGGTLRLRTAEAPADNPLGRRAALLEVSDSGVGMGPEVQARIFDPFFSTKGPRGTGMGLAMVYSTVQRHQGRIEVRSQPGAGSRFQVLLPVQRELPGEAPARAPAPAAAAPSLEVLVVEDDPSVRRVLSQLLRRFGHRVEAVESGEAALARLAERGYDLVCSDLGMPGMSGWELLRRARAGRPELMTLLITGWGDQIDPEDALRQGVDQVLAKPFDAAGLQQSVQALAARRGM